MRIGHRPEVQLRAPRELVPGTRVPLQLIVKPAREVAIEFIDLTFEAVERASGAGNSNAGEAVRLVARRVRLAGARVLPAGSHELRSELDVPGFLPPSYSGPHGSTEYVVSTRVSVPWWPDRTESWVLFVRRPPVELVAPRPVYYATDRSGPRGREPHIECSLPDEMVVPGEVLSGSFALGNVAHNRYRQVKLSLVGTEQVFHSDGRLKATTELARYSLAVPLQSPSEAEPISFRMRLPAVMAPSFRSRLWSVSWLLAVSADLGWARDVTMQVPLVVVSPGSRRAEGAQLAVPTIGSDRMRRIWHAVGEELGMELSGDVLRGREGDVDVAVRREHRGADGIFLVGELRYPSLGLHLDGGVASGFQRLLGGGISFGDAAWDGTHYIAGREPDQVRSFGAVLFDRLRQHRVADLDDEHLVLERADAGTIQSALLLFATSLVELARAIPAARDAIPPPARMAHAVPAWERLAASLEGSLELARMAVRGHVDGRACEVFTDWSPDGQPLRTVLAVSTATPIGEEHRLRWSAAGYESGDLTRAPRDAADLLLSLQEGALSLELAEDGMRLSLGAPIEAPEPDVSRRLRRMIRVLALLRERSGPYR